MNLLELTRICYNLGVSGPGADAASEPDEDAGQGQDAPAGQAGALCAVRGGVERQVPQPR